MKDFDLSAFLADLRTLCAIDSGHFNAPGTAAVADFFESRYRALGLKTERRYYDNNDFAPFLTARNSEDEQIDVLFVAHIGKFVKVSGGIMNTHSRHSDARAELMCAHALRSGADLETAKAILETITTEEAMEIIRMHGLQDAVMEQMAEKVHQYMQHRVEGAIQTEAILFSNRFGYLGETKGAEKLAEKFKYDL